MKSFIRLWTQQNRGSRFPNEKVYLHWSDCFGNMQVSSAATSLDFVVEFV